MTGCVDAARVLIGEATIRYVGHQHVTFPES
jgi:hypothetical protein